MKAFLKAYGHQIDPALPEGNCLFCALTKQMTGDPSRHPEPRKILTTYFSNPQVFGRDWTIGNCSLEEQLDQVSKLGHAEIKAAASLCQKPIYIATDSLSVSKCMWTVFPPFHPAQLKFGTNDTWKRFISQPTQWYKIVYSQGCHYDGSLPLQKENPQDVITIIL